MPMRTIRTVRRMIDDLFKEREKVPKREIFQRAVQEPIPPDVMTYFRRLPDKEYSKQGLRDTLNQLIARRGRVYAIGRI